MPVARARAAVNGMETLLVPPESVPDVAHSINAECAARGLPHAAVNGAVEESTLGMRRCAGLSLFDLRGVP